MTPTLFTFKTHQIRVVDLDGQPWFVAADVCRALGLNLRSGTGSHLRAFQDWVTRDVLPAIRKDGAYVMGEEKVATGELSEGVLGGGERRGSHHHSSALFLSPTCGGISEAVAQGCQLTTKPKTLPKQMKI